MLLTEKYNTQEVHTTNSDSKEQTSAIIIGEQLDRNDHYSLWAVKIAAM